MRRAGLLQFVLSSSTGSRAVLSRLSNSLGILLVAAFFLATPVTAQREQPASKPYANINRDAIDYRGPGRDPAHDLAGLEVKIGMLVPLQGPRQAEGAALLQAARLALEDEAAYPLPEGRRLVLTPRDESGPWGQASNRIVELVLEDRALAVVTSTSGITAHLAEQVGNKLGVPILTLASDAGTTQTNIPWIFRLPPDDRAQAAAFARDIYAERHFKRVLLVTEDDRDGRLGSEAFLNTARQFGGPAPDEVQINSSRPVTQPLRAQMDTANPEAVVIWAAADLSAKIVEEIRNAKSALPIFLCQKAAASPPRQSVGSRQEDSALAERHDRGQTGGVWVVVSRQSEEADAKRDFTRRYRQRTGNSPSIAAMQAYDAIRLLATSLRQSGPNRARLRDRLAETKNFAGVSGVVSFDHAGNDLAAVTLTRLW